jgi:hypothetical protein
VAESLTSVQQIESSAPRYYPGREGVRLLQHSLARSRFPCSCFLARSRFPCAPVNHWLTSIEWGRRTHALGVRYLKVRSFGGRDSVDERSTLL